jgi:hypothetical protein
VPDPRRLIDDSSGFEAELLRAGRGDALPAQSAATISAALGVAPPIAPIVPGATGAVAKATASKVVASLLGVSAGGALAVWVAVQAFTPAAALKPHEPPRAGHGAAIVADVPVLPPPASAQVVEVPEPVSVPSAPLRHRALPGPERDRLPLELEALDRARSALAGGDASRALALLDEYSARFPKARLRAESAVLRVEALVARGQKDAAIRLGRELLVREPNGPYARRVHSLLERAGAPTKR